MDLDKALNGMFDAQNKLRSTQGVNNPTFMSEQMMRLSQYAGAVEENLAGIEKVYEIDYAVKLKERLIDRKPPMKVTQAEREVDIQMAEEKGQIKYLTRLVASAWRQVGVTQSRYNHLAREATTQI